ncbi:hypothetical protein BpHYR1_017916 [Brachionus plicatilis]|uniref:Uncharacterized protein n=1 Tax=Brachionus plicatilis TaxID=10195 RepID=A0A3M7SX98_BRAPC|nr:hypothetical protein BpHYR1_017916 [Brachionus plicatilis]
MPLNRKMYPIFKLISLKNTIKSVIKFQIRSFRNSICSDLVDLVLPFQQSKIPKYPLYLNLAARIVPLKDEP